MPMQSPHQRVVSEHGSKNDLVDKVAKLIEPVEGESADEHKRRLRNVANRKLLHLQALGEKVKELGGREKIVERILEAKKQPKDHEYGDHLKTLPLGKLVDLAGSTQRRAAGKAKKKPKSQRRKKN